MFTRAHQTVAPLAAVSLSFMAGACAVMGPPRPPLPPSDSAPDCPPPIATVEEGQPRGLVVALSTAEGCYDGDELVLLRAQAQTRDKADTFEPIYQFVIGASDGPPSREGEVRFLDQDLADGTTYVYAAGVRSTAGEWVTTGATQSVAWTLPPAAPAPVAAVPVGNHVQITWPVRPRFGAVVFRRELGTSAGYVRLTAPLVAGTVDFVDDGVQPGKLYVYLVSAVVFRDRVPFIGAPSPEVIVEAMPEGPLAPPASKPAGPLPTEVSPAAAPEASP